MHCLRTRTIERTGVNELLRQMHKAICEIINGQFLTSTQIPKLQVTSLATSLHEKRNGEFLCTLEQRFTDADLYNSRLGGYVVTN